MDSLMRYAHCEGHTDLVYEESGKFVITGGADGDIRIFDGFEDDDPISHHIGDTVTALAMKNNILYVATDSHAVLAYTYPDIVCDGIVLQFYTLIYDIDCSNSGQFVAAGGGDFLIKIYNNKDKKFVTCRGHDAPILSIAFDPQEKFLASSSCDGTVMLWKVSNTFCVKTMSLIKKSNDMCNSGTLCKMQWHPNNGKYLAVPMQQEIKFYERESWICSFTFSGEDIPPSVDFSICAIRHCGNYIAASASNGTIVVWDLKSKKCIGKNPHNKDIKVCSLAWNTSEKIEISFCDVEGQLGMFDDFVANCKNIKNLTGDTEMEAFAKELDNIDNFDEQYDELFKNNGPIDDDVDNAFDIGAIKAELEPKIFGLDNTPPPATDDISAPTVEESKPILTTPLQTSFQPGSTPLHLEHRFMVFNNVGIVRCYNTEEENSIDVEFHDASVYRPLHVNNIHGFTMASLSTEALLLASTKADEAASKLQCVYFGTWDSNKEWTIDMPEDEDIEAIAVGSGWVVAGTDQRFIRLYTMSGFQCEVFCVPGPIVCLATFENHLAVAYHRGPGIPGEQNMGLMYVNVNLKSQCLCKDYALPLTSKAFLTWMGFSDEGQLCTVDTSGIIRMLHTSSITKWIPIANTKSQTKSVSDNCFVIGLSEVGQQIRCILCKSSRYPTTLPCPTVKVLPFNLPFCDTKTDKGRLEEEYGRCSMLINHLKPLVDKNEDFYSTLTTTERKLSDVLLKLFALATRNDHEHRALDIAKLMPNPQVVQGAVKYATQTHHKTLADRLGKVILQKLTEAEGELETDIGEMFKEEEEFPLQASSSHAIQHDYLRDATVKKILPKALHMGRQKYANATVSQKLTGEEKSNDDELFINRQKEPVSLLPSSPAVNPFKVESKMRESASNMDEMISESTKRLSSKISNSSVSEKEDSGEVMKEKPLKLGPKKFGFPLFLEKNKEKLIAENPGLGDGEIAKIATKLFKALSPEEKENFKAKPKKVSNLSSVATSKRKKAVEDKTDQSSESKKSKSSNDVPASSGRINFSLFEYVKKTLE